MITITGNKGLMKIKGQHSVWIEPKQGMFKMQIRVLSGELRVNHCCYTPDGGTWLESPNGKRQTHYDVSEGNDMVMCYDNEQFSPKVIDVSPNIYYNLGE